MHNHLLYVEHDIKHFMCIFHSIPTLVYEPHMNLIIPYGIRHFYSH